MPALQGGCNILDLKEPLNGPLAMVDEVTLHAISDFFARQPAPVPLSMALGELIEWQGKSSSLLIPKEITYLKMGLSHIADNPNWITDWLNLRAQIETTNKKKFQWIAVAYADWQQANSVSPEEVLAAAISSQCSGLLIDTFSKRGKGLLDCLSFAQIKSLQEQAQTHHLLFALAGSISHENLGALSEVAPDIIGIRGAACRGNQRTSRVEAQAVREFRKQIDRQFTLTESG